MLYLVIKEKNLGLPKVSFWIHCFNYQEIQHVNHKTGNNGEICNLILEDLIKNISCVIITLYCVQCS